MKGFKIVVRYPLYDAYITAILCTLIGISAGQCPYGSKGDQCELCIDDFYRPYTNDYCQPCDCTNNNDPFYPGPKCNNVTGVCNRCIFHTMGDNCDLCDQDFFGDARYRTCQRCHCNDCGRKSCNSQTGDCVCKDNVIGKYCDECAAEHFGLRSCKGCQPCNCSPVGSFCNDCHPETGECKCKPGVTGRSCDKCLPSFWKFSENGCIPCNCPNQRFIFDSFLLITLSNRRCFVSDLVISLMELVCLAASAR